MRTALFITAIALAMFDNARAQGDSMNRCPGDVPSMEPPVVAFVDSVSLDDVLRAVEDARSASHHGAESSALLAKLWASDSATVLASLVMLAINPSVANDRQAMTAAWLYRAASGKAYPILSNLLIGRDEYRVIGLSAIERLDSQVERKVVALMACQAAWLIKEATEPSSYISQLPVELSPTWLWRARDELREAVRLLGQDDPTVKALRRVLHPGELPASE